MIERFMKRPGENILPSTDDPTMLLVMDGAPDDVRLPQELGGHIERVVSSFTNPCPHCQAPVRHLRLETVYVAECDQFYWYRRR